MRISDWSSDVCSSDLEVAQDLRHARQGGQRDLALDLDGGQDLGEIAVAAHLHSTLEADLQDLFVVGSAPAVYHPLPRLSGHLRFGSLFRHRFFIHFLLFFVFLALRPLLLFHLPSSFSLSFSPL